MRTNDQHSRPTTTLAADEIRRLVRDDETPTRLPRSSDSIRRERIDTPTTEMSSVAINELLAAEPRTSPAVISRELRHDTVTDPGATTALAPQTVAALASERTAREVEVAAATGAMERVARPPMPRAPSLRLPFVIAAIAAVAIVAIILLR